MEEKQERFREADADTERLSARYDAACKRVLSEKFILAWIMKACLEEYKGCDVSDIAERYIEGTPEVSSSPVFPEDGGLIRGLDTEDKSIREGTVTYDVRFRAVAPHSGEPIGLIVNVEAQNRFNPGYPLVKRGVYYCCRMISSQYGREFTKSHYEKIKKVYSIWICMNPPKNRQNTIVRYRLAEEELVGDTREPAENYDLLSVVMLCLGRPEEGRYDGVLRMLDVLFSEEIAPADKSRILQQEYEIPLTDKMTEEVSFMCNLSQGVLERGYIKGMEKGIAEGQAKGRAEGRAEGMETGVLSSIRSLVKNMGLSPEQAMAALDIPQQERQKYRDLLEQSK